MNLKKIIKNNTLIKWIKIILGYLYFGFLHIICSFCKIKNNKIVVCSFYGKGYSDNPKYIVEELLNRNLNVDIVWLLDNPSMYILPNKIRKIRIFSIKSVYELLTAKVWIDNCRKYFFYNIFKPNGTIYIQTWHGGIGLKRAEKEVENHLAKSYIYSAKHDSKMIDYFLSGSKLQSKDIKENFWYKGKIEEFGLPRNDQLINKQNWLKEKVYSFYKLNSYTKICLIAPTFRKGNVQAGFVDFGSLKKTLKEKFDGEWIIFLRLHPNIRDTEIELPDYVVNASFYEDSQELLCAADILITDYSSIMFDMMLCNKPVFIYADDINEYRKDRNFKFRFEELPFVCAESNEELIKNIERFNREIYLQNLSKFRRKVVLYENGNASDKIVTKISEIINEKISPME